MVDISRHREIINPLACNIPMHIIGCGATGSWIATLLAKMGFSNIHLYDFDVVEAHNLANQNFTNADIDKKKITALAEKMREYNPEIRVIENDIKVDSNFEFNGIVFLLTDSMKSRIEIFKNCVENKPQVKLLIETRMGVSEGMVYSIQPCKYHEQKLYNETLYTDENAAVSACGTPLTIIPTGFGIASTAIWQLINFLNGEEIINEIVVNYKDMSVFCQRYGI